MHAKIAFCIKASVLFLTLLLTGLASQAAEQAVEPSGEIPEHHINDTLICGSDGVCGNFNSPDIIAQNISKAAHDVFRKLNSDGQTTPVFDVCTENEEFQQMECNVSNTNTPLILTCDIFASAGFGNADCGDLFGSGIDMHCNVETDSPNNGCDTNIDPIKLCEVDQDSCEAVVSRAKLCETGALSCNGPLPKKPNKEIFTDLVTSSCRNAANSNNNAFSQFCDVLGENPGQEAEIIAAVLPTKLDLSADAGMMSMQQVSSYISSRLSQLRVTPAKVSSNNKKPENLYPVAGQWLPAFTQIAQLDGMSNSASDVSPVANDSLDATINISKDGRFSLYVNAAFMVAKQDTTADESASDSKTAQFTIGSDYRLSNELVLGAAFTFSDMNSDFGNNKEDSLNQQSYNLSLYTLYYHKQWWLDGSLMLGFNRYDQERDITCSGSCSSLNNTYEANYNGNVQSLTLSSGYDFVFSRLTLSPFAQLQGGTVNIEAYDESAKKTGGATALLSLDKQSRDFANINIGSYLRYVLNTKKAVFIPSLRVVLNHSLEDDIQSVSGHFVGDESARFSMAANAMDDTYLTIGAGMNFQLQNGNSGFIDLETIEAYDNLNQYRITGGWRWEF